MQPVKLFGIYGGTSPNFEDGVTLPLSIDGNGALKSSGALSPTIVSGQLSATAANAGTAVVLTTSQACSEVTIQAPAGNSVAVVFGSSTTTCYMELAPGHDFTIPVSNVNMIYVKSSTSDTTPKVSWIARA